VAISELFYFTMFYVIDNTIVQYRYLGSRAATFCCLLFCAFVLGQFRPTIRIINLQLVLINE